MQRKTNLIEVKSQFRCLVNYREEKVDHIGNTTGVGIETVDDQIANDIDDRSTQR